MIKILVTGAGGQLGLSIQKITKELKNSVFILTDEKELDITDKHKVNDFFVLHKPDYCINCAAYTAVDKAEDESNLAFKINSEGVENLIEACKLQDTILIQVSTDFIFDGNAKTPYTERDVPDPINTYGKSKYEAERLIVNHLEKYYILRTSWLYSEYGSNFLKTMIGLGKKNKSLRVINDQIGTPTYAGDLASVILRIIADHQCDFGIYHYSNSGVTSWHGFAETIFQFNGMEIDVLPVSTEEYQTKATRPKFSVLDKSKIKECLDITVPDWKDSLEQCIARMK